jgi:MFS family permease
VLIVLSVLGIPALLLLLTIREAPRSADASAPEASWRETFAFMRLHWPVYVPILIFSACNSMKANAYGAFIASIPQRRWDIPISAVGKQLGWMMLIAAPLGLWIMGSITDALAKRIGARGPALVGIGCIAVGLICATGAPIAPSPGAFYALACGDFFVGGGGFAIAGILIAMITPPQNMGKTSAVQLFVYGLIGMGVGPFVAGVFSDELFPGKAGLAPALSLACGIFMSLSLVCALLLYRNIGRSAVIRS